MLFLVLFFDKATALLAEGSVPKLAVSWQRHPAHGLCLRDLGPRPGRRPRADATGHCPVPLPLPATAQGPRSSHSHNRALPPPTVLAGPHRLHYAMVALHAYVSMGAPPPLGLAQLHAVPVILAPVHGAPSRSGPPGVRPHTPAPAWAGRRSPAWRRYENKPAQWSVKFETEPTLGTIYFRRFHYAKVRRGSPTHPRVQALSAVAHDLPAEQKKVACPGRRRRCSPPGRCCGHVTAALPCAGKGGEPRDRWRR